MAGSNNFVQFDPAKTQDFLTDGDYAANATRLGGIVNGAQASSAVHNKLFYQISTMTMALGEMMKAKGYVISDAVLATLITALAHIMTEADMTPYAKTADIIVPDVFAANFPKVQSSNGYQVFPGGTMMQWGKYASNLPDNASISITFPVAFTTVCWNLQISTENASDWLADKWGTIVSLSKTGATIKILTEATGQNATGMYWFAIGY